MGAFRKRDVSHRRDLGSVEINNVEISTSKEVDIKGSPTTVVELKKVNLRKYAETLNLPKSEEYSLEAMLRSGHVPEEVPVSGLLDNPDPTAIENYGQEGVLFDKLLSHAPAEPAPATVTPDSSTQTE